MNKFEQASSDDHKPHLVLTAGTSPTSRKEVTGISGSEVETCGSISSTCYSSGRTTKISLAGGPRSDGGGRLVGSKV